MSGFDAQSPAMVKYTEKWERGMERLAVRWEQVDAKAGYEKRTDVLDRVRPEFGTYPLSPAQCLTNMFELAWTNGENTTKVHVVVIAFERLHPITGKKLFMHKDLHYETWDVKVIQGNFLGNWLAAMERDSDDLVGACGDGHEFIFLNADKFSKADADSLAKMGEHTRTNPIICQTGIDKKSSAYVISAGVVAYDVALTPTAPLQPLDVHTDAGAHNYGVKLTTLDVVRAIVMWEPGHRDPRVGNSGMGWLSYGDNRLMYDWAQGVFALGAPLFSNDGSEEWASNFGTLARQHLLYLRPDPIDILAPDARRELAKGVSLDVIGSNSGKVFLRADLWRPIAFTGVSRMHPTNPHPEKASCASLVEEYLHRVASLVGGVSWDSLIRNEMPEVKKQAELANSRIRNRLRRLPVFALHYRPRGEKQAKIITYGRQAHITRYTIFSLVGQCADEYMFEIGDNGRQLSVTQYFAEMGIELKYGRSLPLVDVAAGKKGSCVMPMELLYIETHLTTGAQLLASKDTNVVPADVTTAILKKAAVEGGARYTQAKVWTGAAHVGTDRTCDTFGLQAQMGGTTEMTKVARFKAPAVKYAKARGDTATDKGGWMTPRGTHYVEPMPIRAEYGVCLHTSLVSSWGKEICSPFLQSMAMTAKNMGIAMDGCPKENMQSYNSADSLRTALKDFEVKKLKIVIVVMPARDSAMYRVVKQWGDVSAGVPTQCLLMTTIRKSINRTTGKVNQDTLYNLLLKMNVKMGGANWDMGAPMPASASEKTAYAEMEKRVKETMYLGVDVRHPRANRCHMHPKCSEQVHSPRNCPNEAAHNMSPTDLTTDSEPPLSGQQSHESSGDTLEKAFSFAAVSGTYTVGGGKSGVSVRVQEKNKEVLVHVKHTLVERLLAYKEGTGALPKRIVYVRDGVGASQFEEVVQEEFKALRDAVKEVYNGVDLDPDCIFVVAQKQHNMRMFDVNGHKGNVVMGTVVCSKSKCVSAEYADFYMVGHKALQGTSKPVHYVLLKACKAVSGTPVEGLTESALIGEMFMLHSMNPRAQKSCGLPAPVTHAHLAAERANLHISDMWVKSPSVDEAHQCIDVNALTKKRMYWM